MKLPTTIRQFNQKFKQWITAQPLTKKEEYMREIKLGDTVRDRITNIEGIVISITEWLYSCKRVRIQQTGLKEDTGSPYESFTVDIYQLELIEEGDYSPVPHKPEWPRLGDTVKDLITGYTGILVAISDMIYRDIPDGSVQPTGTDQATGGPVASWAFSLSGLKVVERGTYTSELISTKDGGDKTATQKTGGDQMEALPAYTPSFDR